MGGQELDNHVRQEFGGLVAQTVSGDLAHWELKPQSLLALVILLDRFTRNIYRGSARAFAGDDHACRPAIDAINQGWDICLAKRMVHFCIGH